MKKIVKALAFCIFFFATMNSAFSGNDELVKTWKYTNGNYQFEWNFATDIAQMSQINPHKTIWKGSLLPAFWLQNSNMQKKYIKAVVLNETTEGNLTKLKLQFADFGNRQHVGKKRKLGYFDYRFSGKLER